MVAAPPADADGVASIVDAIRAEEGDAFGEQFDAADDASFAQLVANACDRYGGLDIFHANFADQSIIFDDRHILDAPDAVLDRTIDVNLKGMARATRHALPRLLDRGGGALIYSSSAAATMGDVERPFYGMSKAGIGALVRHVANRWGRQGIRANAILPGYIMTAAIDSAIDADSRADMQSKTPSPRLGRSEDIAAMVALLSSEDGEWINGQMISVDGGLTMR